MLSDGVSSESISAADLPAAKPILVLEYGQLQWLLQQGVSFPHESVQPLVIGSYEERTHMQKSHPQLGSEVSADWTWPVHLIVSPSIIVSRCMSSKSSAASQVIAELLEIIPDNFLCAAAAPRLRRASAPSL